MERIDDEIKRLSAELEQQSMMTSALRSAQSRLISSLTKNSNALTKSVVATLQQVQSVRNESALTARSIEIKRKQLDQANRQNSVDQRYFSETTRNLNENRDRIRQLKALGSRRTAAETRELGTRIAFHKGLVEDNNSARAASKRSQSAVDEHTNQLKIKTQQLKYLKYQLLADAIGSAASGLQSLITTIRKTQQQFGIAADQAVQLQFGNLKSSISSYADALTGAGPVATMEQIAATQSAFQAQFGGVLDPEAAKRLTQEAIQLGVTSEQMATARRVFMTQTGSNLAQATKQTDKFIDEFKKKGLTAKDAMQAISQYSELLARNGSRFASSFHRAAADAKKIAVDLNKVDQIGDNIINNFEGFLESQAELGAMGFGFDSTRLAEIAATGDTSALFNELRSQLASTGKDIQKLSRPEQLALSEAFGVPMAELQRLASKGGGAGEKTVQQYQEESNSLLTRMINILEGFGKILGIISAAIAGTIAVSTSATAMNTGILATGSIGGALTSLPGLLGPLVAISAGIATIVAAVKFWQAGSKNVEEGKRKIEIGESGGAGQLIKGRAQQGAGVGAGVGATGAGLLAGLALIGSGVGIPAGLALIGASMAAGGIAGGVTGGATGATVGLAEAGVRKTAKPGDDVISQAGYGKRSLVTPSGVIALNNKDNIIAYADDLMGTERLPYGIISKQMGTLEMLSTNKLAQISSSFEKMFSGLDKISLFGDKLNASVNKLIKPDGLLGSVSKFTSSLQKTVASTTSGITGKISSIFGGKDGTGGILGNITKLSSGINQKLSGFLGGKDGTDGILGGINKKLGGLFSGGDKLLASISGGLEKKIGSVTGSVSKFLGGGVGKIFGGGIGNLLGSATGGPLGMLAGLAGPVLSKIPVVGKIASIVSNPIGAVSGVAKKIGGFLGGLFGKKKKSTGETSLASTKSLVNPMKFGGSFSNTLLARQKAKQLSVGSKSVAGIAPSPEDNLEMMAMASAPTAQSLNLAGVATSGTQPATPVATQNVSVDTTKIEQTLAQFINALSRVQIHMDGNKVGKVLVDTTNAASSVGVFRST